MKMTIKFKDINENNKKEKIKNKRSVAASPITSFDLAFKKTQILTTAINGGCLRTTLRPFYKSEDPETQRNKKARKSLSVATMSALQNSSSFSPKPTPRRLAVAGSKPFFLPPSFSSSSSSSFRRRRRRFGLASTSTSVSSTPVVAVASLKVTLPCRPSVRRYACVEFLIISRFESGSGKFGWSHQDLERLHQSKLLGCSRLLPAREVRQCP